MNSRSFMRARVLVGSLALLGAFLTQPTVAAAQPSNVEASSVVAAARPRASLSAKAVVQKRTGYVRVTARSNAKYVAIRYKTKSGRIKTRYLRMRSGSGAATLAAGTRYVKAKALATTRLKATAWRSVSITKPTTTAPTPTPKPVQPAPARTISNGVPAYASVGDAKAANDGDYGTAWSVPAGETGWLAYDLSGVPAVDRQSVVLDWYAAFDDGYTTAGIQGACPAYAGRPLMGDYTIEVNSAAGGTGAAPASGWRQVASVQGNLALSGQHLVSLAGANWIRVTGSGHAFPNAWDSQGRVTGHGNAPVEINVDVATAVNGDSGGWLFLGDSITAGYSGHVSILDPQGASVAGIGQLISAGTGGAYQPLVQNNGVACSKSEDALTWVDTMLDNFHGHYVTLNFGGNDGYWGRSDDSDLQPYYLRMEALVKKVTARGMVAVVPTVTWPNHPDIPIWDPYIQKLNDQIRRLYANHPEVVPGPDLYTLLKGHSELYEGGTVGNVHPSEQGSALVRKAWASVILDKVYQQ